MSKARNLTGQPVFSQLLSYVPKGMVDDLARSCGTDKGTRYFTTHSHLVTMLYAVLNNCRSIREVTSGLLAWDHRINHLGMDFFPRRSTISDANQRRSEEVFGKIYERVYARYRRFLPDSRPKKKKSKLFIADSTTISLFQEVMRNAGRSPINGKRKGGVKVHTLIQSDEDVPCLVRFTSGAAADSPFLKEIKLPEGSILAFDKGYNNYSEFQRFSDEGVTWVTRKRKTAVFKRSADLEVSPAQQSKGVQKDQLIVLGHDHNNNQTHVKARLIKYKDSVSRKGFQFITNNTRLSAATLAGVYRQRWQIEVLFKRFKQTYPLKYFLGDSENAIKIQIWCTLIADLLIKITKGIAGKKWSFSNLASLIRLHLMTYVHLATFLINPERTLRVNLSKVPNQPLLFYT